MKVHLGIGEYAINGYLNIDPLGGPDKVAGDVKNLDNWCEPASCTEVYAPQMLDFIHGSQVLDVIRNWASKLRHGGKIVIGGTDVFEVAKGIISRQLTIPDANKLLYNTVGVSPFIKLACYTWPDIHGILVELGLKVIHKRIDDRKFYIEAERE